MSHFSIGYQPEEGNGVLLKVALQNELHDIRHDSRAGSYQKSIGYYLKMVNWVAYPLVTGLTK